MIVHNQRFIQRASARMEGSVLLWLLIIPILIGLGGFVLGKGRITWPEFIVQELACILVIGIGYAIAYWGQTSDTEIWNGVITRKWEGTSGCCHSYPCNCHQVCSGSGSSQSCSTVCQTCYLHGHDVTWNAVTSNGETAFADGCNAPGSSPPSRWTQIVVGEPTAVEHRFTNYIKANPDSILRRHGVAEQFHGKLPSYPRVVDHYRVRRFLVLGVPVPNADALDAHLDRINANLGVVREVNLTVIVTSVSDQMYLEALTEHWLGGKKNDLVVVIGVPEYPRIAWVGVMSWTRVEEVKLGIRDRTMALGTFDGERVLGIVADEVQAKFIRRPMEDFAYLRATLAPPAWAQWLLFILGTVLAIVLEVFFWRNDPFDRGYDAFSGRFRAGRRYASSW